MMNRAQVVELIQKMQGGMSQNKFARSIGISQAHISDLYAGKVNPGDLLCQKLGLERVISYRQAS